MLRWVMLLSLWAGSASAQSVLDAIVARGTVRVGLTGDYRPFSVKDGSGHFEGLDVDMAESLAHGLGVKLEIVPTAWPKLMADLQSGAYDIGMGGITITLERAKTALFSAPVLRAGKTAIARCSDKARFGSLAAIDMPGVRVITNPGGTNERFDRSHLKQAEIVVFSDNTQIFDELVASHADVMITDSVETRLQQRLHPELCAINPDMPFEFAELGYLLPRDSALKAWVDQWLHIQIENGEQKRLLAKWLN